MDRIKLAHVQLLPLLSGVQIMMLNLLNSLDREKYEIYVISKPGGALVDKVKELGYHYIGIGTLRRNLSPLDIVAIIHLWMVFSRYRFDIVHTHSSKTGLLGRIAARFAGVKKIIHTVHGFPFHQHQPAIAGLLYRYLEKFAGYFCDKIVVVNNYEREEAIKSGLLPAHKLLTIYNGIKYEPYVKNKNRSLAAKWVPQEIDKPLIIGTIARFTAAKNIINLVSIAVEVCKQSDNIVFFFIGDGELFSGCKKIVTDNVQQKKIIMPGWQTNIKEWLDNLDVFLLFSLWEGLSISILEAMAAGLPIIASDIKGNNELISNENGILIDVKDHNRLQETLLSLPDRREQLIRWGANSLYRVKEKFDHSEFVKKYVELYESDNK